MTVRTAGAHTSPRTTLVALAVGGLALAVRVPPALSHPLWQDEVASARILIRPAASALRGVVGTESAPPGWYGLAWLAHHVGVAVSDVRLLSAVAGALLAGLTVVYAARLLPLSLASLAGAMVALGWQPLVHGWELRAYALFALLAIVFVLALEWAAAAPATGRLVVLGTSVAAGSVTHYFFLLTLGSGVIWMWLSPEFRAARKRVMSACAIGLAPLIAWAPAAWVQYRHGGFLWIGPFDARDVVHSYARLLVRSLPSGAPGLLLGGLAVVVVLTGCMMLWRRSAAGRLCALATVLPVAAASLAWLAGAQVFTVRNVLCVAPFAAVATAATLLLLPRQLELAAVAVAVGLLVVSYVGSRSPPPPYDEIADALVEEGWTPADPILLFAPSFAYLYPLGWYLPRHEVLSLADVASGSECPDVYVVSVRGLSTPPSASRHIGAAIVARVSGRSAIWQELRRRAGVVAAAQDGLPRCVK